MDARLERRRFLSYAAALPLLPAMAHAQGADTLRIVVGYQAGGTVDIVARKIAQKLAGRPGGHAIVENKTGAAGRIAADDVRKAPAGTALLVTPASTMTMYPHVYRQLSYDPFTDFVPVSTVATTAFVLAVGPQVPTDVRTLDDLTRWGKAQGAPVPCGHAGAGSMPHFMALLIARALGIAITPVPYRGGGAALQAVAAGEAPMGVGTEGAARAPAQGGRLRVLATTWDHASPFFPQAPGFRDAGMPGLDQREWFGVFAPARSSPAQVAAVADVLRALPRDADVVETWERAGLVMDVSGPAALAAAMRAEYEFWGPVVKASGFTPEA